MTPTDLLALLPAARLHRPAGATDEAVTDVTHDSRQAGPGVLYAARPGHRADGHDFAPAAVAAGSPALLVERPLDLPVPQIVVPRVADVLGVVAAAVHGTPSADLQVIGVTGTSGKTTTTFLLESALAAAGATTGLVGTIETRSAGRTVAGVRTTPEATDLQRLLAQMRRDGVTHVAMEVSSHGLALGRVTGTRFAAALFTNLSQDHLDFHADMADYYAAKARLFTADLTPVGVVTVDGEWGRRLAREATCDVVTLAVHGPADVELAGPVHRTVTAGRPRTAFTARVRGTEVDVELALPGEFNVANALGALALADLVGIDLPTAAAGVAALAGVPGRVEPVEAGQDFLVLVDYAHKPEAVAKVLATARTLASGRVIVVLGCGGDRDRAKRPLMARAAVEGADLAVLTSDNPRSEDPEAILDEMMAGLDDPSRVVREVDRATAIGVALDAAAAGDVVVIAGKGHETYQELADATIDFDDREVARRHLERAA